MKLALRLLAFASAFSILFLANLLQAIILNQEPVDFQDSNSVDNDNDIISINNIIIKSENIEQQAVQLKGRTRGFYREKIEEGEQAAKRQFSTKFIVLTTGEQIKLYPFALEGAKQEESLTNLANNYYLIKPAEVLVRDHRAAVERFGNNSLSRWIVEKTLIKSINATKLQGDHQNNRKASILPDQQDESHEYYEGNISGWKKPWILDVDYFFNANFCLNQDVNNTPVDLLNDRDCLVVVWLDKSNKLVRFGSLDLSRNPILDSNSSSRQLAISLAGKNQVLWLHEFKPIDVSQSLERPQGANNNNNLELFAMTIDKRRSRLHVAFSDGSQLGPNRILSGKFKANLKPSSTIKRTDQLDDENVISFNNDNRDSTEPTSFENLSVDEVSGNWLFYFDKRTGGKIFALNVNNKNTGERLTNQMGSGNAHFWSSNQALVRDIPLGDLMKPSDKTGANTTGLAMDSKRRRLFWLTDNNELFSCNYVGEDARLVGLLSPRPAIRSVESMQVFHDIIYVSDPIKKSLIAYRLNADKRDQSNRSMGGQQQRAREILDSDNIRSTHLVLLVEMPTLYGFRLIDLNQVRSANDDTDEKNADGCADKIYIDSGAASKPTFFEQLQNLLIGKQTPPGKGEELNQLWGRTYSTNTNNRRDQLDKENHNSFHRQYDKLSLFLLEIGIIQLLALLIWLAFPWLKCKIIEIKTQKDDYSDKTSILKKSPV